MEEALPFSCVNLTIYSAKKTKQNKTKTKKKKQQYSMRVMLECTYFSISLQANRQIRCAVNGRQEEQERERRDSEE